MELLADENQKIDGYITEDVLGRGFRSIVYKGRVGDTAGAAVVVKVVKIPAEFTISDIFFDSANLHHPNIIPVKKLSAMAEGSVYSVRHFVEGSTLEDMLSQRGAIETREAMHYLAQLASAIDYIHGQGAIHGNIKPSNVVVDARFRAMLFDLGVRNPLMLKAEAEPLPVTFAHYSAPEMLRGEPATAAADIFSFGVLAFELLTGSRPFPGRDYAGVRENVQSSPPLSFDDVGSKLPVAVAECFSRVLSKEPSRRYATAFDFVQGLGRIMGIYLDEFGLVGGFSALQAASTEVDRRVRAKTVMMSPGAIERMGTTEIRPSTMVPSSHDASPKDSPTVELSAVELSGAEEADTAGDSDVPSSNSSLSKSPASPIFGVPVEPAPSAPLPAPPLSTGSQLKVVFFALMLGLVGAVGYKLLSNESVTVSELIPTPTRATSGYPPPTSETAPPVTTASTAAVDPLLQSTDVRTREVILEAFNSTSISTVRGALEEAVKLGDVTLLPEMVELADRPEYTVRIDLLKALAQPPFLDRDESFAVVAKLITDSEYLVRGFAGRALVASKRSDAAALLSQRLAEEKNAIVLKVLSQR